MEHSPEQRQVIVDHICDVMVSNKWSLSKVLAQDDELPSYSLVTKWQRLNEAIREQIAHAREAALEGLIETMIEISEQTGLDHNEKRVRLIAIEKAAQMLAPRRFNMKHNDITSGGEKIAAAPIASSNDRIDALLQLAAQRMALPAPRIIDVTPSPPALSDLLD